MSKNCEYIDSILTRSGRDQAQRFNELLDPDSLKLHDFDVEDWMLFAYNFAKQINYFDSKDAELPSGNWQDFFKYVDIEGETVPRRGELNYVKLKNAITDTLEKQTEGGEVNPHFTLFVCFLKLLQFSQDRFNGLTKRHLDFYYKEVLMVDKLPATEDKAHVLFEIAKKSITEKIDEGTALDGGKDSEGKKRIYKTTNILVANKAKIAALKNINHHQHTQDDGTVVKEIKASPIANSYGGNGEDFPDEATYWWPFGYPSTEIDVPALDNAKVGFSIASELFQLQEGKRTINISAEYTQVSSKNGGTELQNILDPSATFSLLEMKDALKIYCSGEEGWIAITSDKITVANMTSGALQVAFDLERDQPAVVAYDQEIHLGSYTTQYPIVKILIDTENTLKGYDIYRRLALNILNAITVNVIVADVESLALENDTGILNAKKPFYPFTTQPVKKSNFTINYPEVFSKPWTSISVKMNWKDTPEVSFVDHYSNYNSPPSTEDFFKATPQILNKKEYENNGVNVELFKDKVEDEYSTAFSFSNSGYELNKNGPLRLSLNQSFLQEQYPKIYALAISNSIKSNDLEGLSIPNEPYIPQVATISLGYTATKRTVLDGTEDIYTNELVQLFHEDPFGQHQEHRFLKEKALTENEVISQEGESSLLINHLVAQHCVGGSLYIGLEAAEVNQQIALLIQVLEGSENPLSSSFEGKQGIEWAVLCNNYWKDLEQNIISNTTENLLTSGIIKFSIPKQATDQNTRLPNGYIWIRAKSHKSYDAVSKIKAIYPQAVEATFDNQNNTLEHLEKGLAAENISKLITRVPQIKGVVQPFNSFGGKPQELDAAYYRRISERLRHKNRAITLWDYENLILQEFPNIYKVKCLNHTNNKENSFLSPGDVTLVVIPDTINKNVFDIFQPRVSKATLLSVEKYINKLNTMHVTAAAINPLYEPVKVSLSVKFYDQYDENFFLKQLNEDITKFLSPWAFDVSRTIDFGVVLYRSVLIDYLEQLYYVDYLEDVTLEKEGEEISATEKPNLISVAPSNPSAILVSAKEHAVNTDLVPCKSVIIKPKEECQI